MAMVMEACILIYVSLNSANRSDMMFSADQHGALMHLLIFATMMLLNIVKL